MPTRILPFLLLALITLITVPLQTLTPLQPAAAQSRDSDIAVELIHTALRTGGVGLWIRNHGPDTIYDPVVVVELSGNSPGFTARNLQNDPEITISGSPPTKLTWTTPEFPGYGSKEIITQAAFPAGHRLTTGILTKYTATVTSPPEDEADQHNNYSEIYQSGRVTDVGRARPSYAVTTLISDTKPTEITFKIIFHTINKDRGVHSRDDNNTSDTTVTALLPAGLKTTAAKTTVSKGQVKVAQGTPGQTITWTLGFLDAQDEPALSITNAPANGHTMTIKATREGQIPTGGQCLTAHVTALPPTRINSEWHDDPSDNTDQACVSPPPTSLKLFEEGELTTWLIHACRAGVPANACDTVDEVDMRLLHSASGKTLLYTNPLIHVRDPQGRVSDSSTTSVTTGATASWQTATKMNVAAALPGTPGYTGTRNGVSIKRSGIPVKDHLSNWSKLTAKMTVAGQGKPTPPGKVSLRSSANGRAIWTMNSSNSWTATLGPFDMGSFYGRSSDYFAEFEKLGTYVLDATETLRHATIDADSDGTMDDFSATNRTIFHVGPIADLEVTDGGDPYNLPPHQTGFAVTATNKHDAKGHGKIVLTLPATATAVRTIPPDTGAFDSSVSPPTWTWDLTDLEYSDRRHAAGLSPSKSVTLAVDGIMAGDSATASIVYDPYTPTINGTQHQGTVFDLDEDNNSATLTARAGAGPKDNAPTLETMGSPDSIIVLKWEPVKAVNGWPVSHYQVQKWVEDENDPKWEDQEPKKVLTTMWVDEAPGEDPQYRARAVNTPGVPGSWSEPVFGDQNTAADAGVEVDLRPNTAGVHRTLRVDEGDEIEYTIKLKSRPSFVVHVQVEADDSLTVITPPAPAEVPPLPNADHVVTFHPAEWKTAKRVKVKVNDDLVIAAPRTAKIRHTLPTTGGINRSAGYGGLTVPELTLTVDDTTVEQAGFASLGAPTLLLAVGETQSYEIRPLVKPTADLTVTLTATPAGVVTIDTDPNTTGNQNTITFRPGDFRAQLDTETLPGTEFYAVPVDSPGPGVVSVTAVSADDAEITITSSGDGNFSTTKGAATQAVKVVAAKPAVSAPEFSTAPTAQTATVGQNPAFSYTAPAATDAQGDIITYAASLTGGSPLPAWLTFTPSTRTFAGTPQVCDGPAALPITITATDDSLPTPQTGSAEFTLTVNGVSGGPAWHETVSPAYYEEYARENGHLGEGGNPDPAYYNRPPLFLDGASITLSLAENSAADVKVGAPLTACDPDGSPLLYKYLDGADGAFFALDEDTGQLTTKSGQTYDYDTDPSYEFLVIVEEQGSVEGWLSAISVTVNLSDDD